MKSRRAWWFWLLLISAVAAVVLLVVSLNRGARFVDAPAGQEVARARDIITQSLVNPKTYYVDFLKETSMAFASDVATALPEGGDSIHLDYGQDARYLITAPRDGLYAISIDFLPDTDNLNDIHLELLVNGDADYAEMRTLGLKQVYVDASKDFPTNSFGDQSAPSVLQRYEWRTQGLHDNNWKTVDPLLFALKQGVNEITLRNLSQGCTFGKISAHPPEERPDYSAYLAAHPDATPQGDIAPIYINAIDYVEKTARDVTARNLTDVGAIPTSAQAQLLNAVVIQYSGNGIVLPVEAPQDGLYAIGLRYQSNADDFPSFISLYLDGEVPYQELCAVALPSTNNALALNLLKDHDGAPYRLYLTKGLHEIRVEVSSQAMLDVSRDLRLLMDHINQFALDVSKITGADIDLTRSWRFTRYMPQIMDYLNAYEVLLTDVISRLQGYVESGIDSSVLSPLQNTFILLDKMQQYPDDLPVYRGAISGDDSSLAQQVGDLYAHVNEAMITLDGMYLSRDASRILQVPKKGLADALGFELARVANTFTNEKFNNLVEGDGILNIWVNRSTTEVDLMQRIVDSVFTPAAGVKVHLSVMPNIDKLIMAATADRTPDVAMGGLSYVPYDLSSRGALHDLTSFDDFWETVGYAPPGSLIPFIFNQGVYAVPETIDVNMMVYRTDIFRSLGIKPPDTWTDLIDILPVLQRYGMNFYHQMAFGTGYKWFYQTMPILQQFNAMAYSTDGLTTLIDQPDAIAGLKFLSDLFTQYSIPTQVPQFAAEFALGRLPVGMADIGTYTLLKYGYPEIEGQWTVALSPGVEQDDGTVSRWYVANGSNACIFQKSTMKDEAWAFIKWWMQADTQIAYANALSDSFGRGYVWTSANLEALSAANIPYEDLRVILDQAKWLRDVPRTPGQYMLERTISDIWNAIVFDGESPQVAADKRILAVKREISKKMLEFKFIDRDGKVLMPYTVRDIDWVADQMEAARNE